jgi:hypothetical protein
MAGNITHHHQTCTDVESEDRFGCFDNRCKVHASAMLGRSLLFGQQLIAQVYKAVVAVLFEHRYNALLVRGQHSL